MERRGFLAALAVSLSPSPRGSLVRGDELGDQASTSLRSRALALHRDCVVFVVHDHNPILPDVPLMQAGGVAGKLFNLGVDVDVEMGLAASAGLREGWSQKIAARLDEVDQTLAAHPDKLLLARTAADIERAQREGKTAILLGVEGGKLLEGRIELLEAFYNRGLRELQLRWAVPNQIVEEKSLTAFGREVVKACQRLGIIVSLTHIPDEAFFEVIGMAMRPPIVCHGAATIPGSEMSDLSDQKIRALAAQRGVVGLHFYSTYLRPTPTVERVVEQIDYIANLVGIETVALGIDFFPTDGAWGRFQRDQGTSRLIWAIPHIGEVVQVTEALLRRNYPEEAIRRVLGGNFLRVCRETFGA